MSDTNFSAGTKITSTWLNAINDFLYHYSPSTSYSPETMSAAVKANAHHILWDITDSADYSAILAGTSTTDHTTILQNAIDTYGAVVLPKGRMNATYLDLDADNSQLLGQGQSLTKLYYTGAGGASVSFIENSSNATTTRLWCKIADLHIIVSTATVGFVINWKSMQFGRISNVWITGSSSANLVGLNMGATWSTTECTYNIISGCYGGLIGNCVVFSDGANTNLFLGNRWQPMATKYAYLVLATAASRVSNNVFIGGAVEFPGTVSGGFSLGQGSDGTVIFGVRFESLLLAIDVTSNALNTTIIGCHYSSNTTDVLNNGTGTLRMDDGVINLKNSSNSSTTALDWYQEGTWTPTVIGATSAGTGTYTLQNGQYQRVGNRVHIEATIIWTAHTGTGNMQIGGLPFTIFNDANMFPPMNLIVENITFSNQIGAMGIPNTTTIGIYSMATGAAIAGVSMDTAGTFRISGSYKVTS